MPQTNINFELVALETKNTLVNVELTKALQKNKQKKKQMESYNSNIIWPLEGRQVMQTESIKSSAEFVNSWSVGRFVSCLALWCL